MRLADANRLYPAELSGGMIKRVAIARAIVLNPKYLFCDEPNSGLDPQTSVVIDNLIHEITQEYNITTIINTHDMNSVMEIGEKIVYIHEGRKWWGGHQGRDSPRGQPRTQRLRLRLGHGQTRTPRPEPAADSAPTRMPTPDPCVPTPPGRLFPHARQAAPAPRRGPVRRRSHRRMPADGPYVAHGPKVAAGGLKLYF